MAISRVGALLYKALQANYSIRWGYKIINSRSEPHAFETVYKSVAGYADAEFPLGSPLQKGKAVGQCNPHLLHTVISSVSHLMQLSCVSQAGKIWNRSHGQTQPCF